MFEVMSLLESATEALSEYVQIQLRHYEPRELDE
jgi:hypothetical protein